MNRLNYIDIPIAINFFVRPYTLEKVIESVKAVKPKLLFLIADGPRPNKPDDVKGCKACRDLVDKMIDWDCKVYKFYNETNKGLFATYFDSMKRVFEVVDYCIFMEDDVVGSVSFFKFCKYCLEKYKDDKRISFVTGINYMPNGISQKPDSDYFFSGEGALQAYGLWKRTFENMNMAFMDNAYAVEATKELAKKLKPGYEKRIAKYEKDIMWQGHIPHVEIYKNFSRLLEYQLCIVPSKNLVTNIGLSSDSTHSADDIRKIPKAKWCVYKTPIYELNFPLQDPKYMICDVEYEKHMDYIQAWQKPGLAFVRRIEAAIRHIIYGDAGRVWDKIKLVVTGKYVFDE